MNYPLIEDAILTKVRRLCVALPQTEEVPAWTGRHFRIRGRSFAHLLAVESPDRACHHILVIRAETGEREALVRSRHPFFALANRVASLGVVLEGATDWTEIGELMTESYGLLAPKKLAALVTGTSTTPGSSAVHRSPTTS